MDSSVFRARSLVPNGQSEQFLLRDKKFDKFWPSWRIFKSTTCRLHLRCFVNGLGCTNRVKATVVCRECYYEELVITLTLLILSCDAFTVTRCAGDGSRQTLATNKPQTQHAIFFLSGNNFSHYKITGVSNVFLCVYAKKSNVHIFIKQYKVAKYRLFLRSSWYRLRVLLKRSTVSMISHLLIVNIHHIKWQQSLYIYGLD